jgi:hypothetical protein
MSIVDRISCSSLCVLNACPHLHWFESWRLSWDCKRVLFTTTSHPMAEHFELTMSCLVSSTLPTILSFTANVRTLKLQLYTTTSNLSQFSTTHCSYRLNISAGKSWCPHTTQILMKKCVCSNSHHYHAQNSLGYLMTFIFPVKHKNILT